MAGPIGVNDKSFADRLRATTKSVLQRRDAEAKLLKAIKSKMMDEARNGRSFYETEYLGCPPEQEKKLIDLLKQEKVKYERKVERRQKQLGWFEMDDSPCGCPEYEDHVVHSFSW